MACATVSPLAASLLENSPFAQPGGEAPAPSAAPAPVEFRGVMQTPEGMRFNLFDPSRNFSEWVGLNERSRSFEVLNFTPDPGKGGSVMVAYQGNRYTVELYRAQIVSVSTPVPPPPPPGAMNQSPGHPLPPASPAVKAGENQPQPVENVAAEIRRRRALREASRQQQRQPQVAPAPGVVPGTVAPPAEPPPGVAPTPR